MPLALVPAQRLQLGLRPTVALVAYAQLLSTDASELERVVDRELRANPALERVDPIPGSAPADAPAEPVDEPGTLAQLASDARASLPRSEHAALELVLGSLDDHGFLTVEPAAIARAAGLAPERVARVVTTVRELGPVGVGCRDVRECLDAQLVRLDVDPALVALARRVVAAGLEDLAAGRYGELARRLGAERERVLDARDLIRTRLRPYPVLDAPLRGGQRQAAPVPDVVIALDGDRIRVDLPEERRCALRVSPSYVTADVAGARAAQTFIRRLDERWSTLRRVVEALAAEQHAFLMHGPCALHPLTQAQLAAALGLHESTVSRAVAGRSALLPCGRVVELRAFFTASLGVQETLRRLVAEERRPLSDDELAGRLSAGGHPVARRTVAKYRGLLGIPPSAQRTRERPFATASGSAKSISPADAMHG